MLSHPVNSYRGDSPLSMSNLPPTSSSDGKQPLTSSSDLGGGRQPLDPSLSLDVHFLAQAYSLVQSALSSESPAELVDSDAPPPSFPSQISEGMAEEDGLLGERENESVDSLLQFAMISSGPFLALDSEHSNTPCSTKSTSPEPSQLAATPVAPPSVADAVSTSSSSNLLPPSLPTTVVDSPLHPPTSTPQEELATRSIPASVACSQEDQKLMTSLASKEDPSLMLLLSQNPKLQEGLRTMLQNNDLLLQSMAVSVPILSTSSTPSVSSLPSSNETAEGSLSASLQTAPAPSTVDVSPSARLPVLAQVIHRGGPGVSLRLISKSSDTFQPPPPSPPLPPPPPPPPPPLPLSPPPASLQSSTKLSTALPSSAVSTTHLSSAPPLSTASMSSTVARPPLALPRVFPRDCLMSSVTKDAQTNPPSPLPISTSLLPSLPPLSPATPTPIVIQPVDQEPMDVDVGQAVVPLDRPPHLADHDYCTYNPTLSLTQNNFNCLLSIPSERLSYAPEVPDSPRTLYKLLKILPRRSSATPRSRSHSKTLSTPTARFKHSK